MEKIKNYVDIFRGENVENFDDYAEKIMNYAEILRLNKIDKKAFETYRTTVSPLTECTSFSLTLTYA